MGVCLGCGGYVEYVGVCCQSPVNTVHGFCSDAVDWYGPDVVDEFILFFDAIEVRIRVSEFPFMFDEGNVQLVGVLGDMVADVFNVGSFAVDLICISVTDHVVVM